MKTLGGVALNTFAFFVIWFFSAFVSVVIAFRGFGDSSTAEYLRLGTAWFVCPAIGGYYAPKLTNSFISDLNIDSVVSSFITIISIIFFAFIAFSIHAYNTQFGGSISDMVQLALQFASMVIRTLMGKSAVKSNSNQTSLSL
jgi:hypothetical protein